jgi:hypothetical protein
VNFGQVDAQVRQSSSIQVKNVIRKHWSRSISYDGSLVEGTIGTPGEYEVSEDEKAFVKDHMIDVLVHCTDQSNLRSQALECVKLIVVKEYPLRWPKFLNQCLSLVSSGDETKVYCGLACLRVIAREFEMKSSAKSREPLEELIRVAMPGLLSLGEQLLKTSSQVSSATLLKFVLKIFYSSVQLRLSPLMADQAVCTRWFELCSNATKVTGTEVDIEESVHGKVQKWALRILHRFFARYGNPDLAGSDDLESENIGYDLKQFSNWWLTTFSPALVVMVSEEVKSMKLSKSARFQAISFLNEAIQHAVSYKALKTQLQTLLFEVIFPLMCFNKEDNETWTSDPEEFIRREFDCMLAFSDPRQAAMEFLKNMVQMRSKDSLSPLLRFCESQLFVESAQPEALKDIARCSRKDGALAIIGSIAPQLCVASRKSKKKKAASAAADRLPDRNQLETLLAQYVLVDFASPVAFLRYRACWVYQQFADEMFAFANPQTTAAAFAGYRRCLADPELPVRVQAGVSVKSFISHEDFGPLIEPAVPELLDQLLKLMHEVDCEPLAATLESLVTDYSEQVLPFAAQAIEQLGKVFVRLMDAPEEDDEAQLACMGSIQTICTLMEGASSKPALFPTLEPACYAVLDKIMTPDGIDYMEEALDILTYLSFYGPEPLNAGIWKYFDLIHQSVCGGQLPGFPVTGSLAEGWAVDYAENMLNVLDNFISRGTQTFVTGKGFCGRPYVQMLFEIVAKSLSNDSEPTQVAGAKIAACVFESCPKGTVDDWLKLFLQLGWSKFSVETCSLNRWLFYQFSMALYYDPVVTAKSAEAVGISNDLFAAYAKLSKFAKSKDERKALCLALCGLLRRMGELGPNHIASTLVKEYVEVLAVQTRDIAELRKKAREAAAEESDDEEDEEDDFEDEIDLQDLDEGQSADQSAKLRMSNRLKEEIAMIREQFGLNEDDDDDEDYDDDDDEACERVSPLDGFNEFSIMKETLSMLGAPALLNWFSQADLVSWNQLLDMNIAQDVQDKPAA